MLSNYNEFINFVVNANRDIILTIRYKTNLKPFYNRVISYKNTY